MFRWLSNLLAPPTLYGTDDLIESIVPGHKDRMAQLDKRSREEDARFQQYLDDTGPFGERACKKRALEQELKDAEWILDYERKLTKLQERLAKGTADAGRSPERLRRLQSHLHSVRRYIKLD